MSTLKASGNSSWAGEAGDLDLAGSRVTLSRRGFCGSVLSAALLPAGPARAAGLDLDRKPDLLTALVKMRGSLDDRLVIGWVRAKRVAVSRGEVEPVCGFVAGTLSRFTRISDEMFSAITLEITHYTDFETGALLTSLIMPFSRRKVAVPAYRFGPATTRYAVNLDEDEKFKPAAGTTEGKFAPAGSVRMTKFIELVCTDRGELFLRHEEYGRVYPSEHSYPSMFYRESTIWSSLADEALSGNTTSVDTRVAYSAMTSWRPWMEMGDIPGHTASTGIGSKVGSLAEMPDDWLRYTRQIHPDVLADPEAVLHAGGTK